MQVVDQGQYVLGMLERILTDMPNVTEGLNKLFAEVTQAHAGGHISDRTATKLHEEIHARRQRQAKGSDARSRPGFHIAPMLRALKQNADSAPEDLTPEAALHAAELARRSRRLILRRWLASVASIPADILQHFTTAGQSVLSFVALKCRYGDRCDLPVNSIANIAQVSERTVQSTIRKAEQMGFLAVQYRKRLPNVVRVASQVWRDWWARLTPFTENQKCLFSFNDLDPLLGAKMVRDTPIPASNPASEAAPVEITDMVVLEALPPAPKRLVPVSTKARPKLVVEPSNLERIAAAKALVEGTAKDRPVSDLDPWERPEVQPWMNLRDRQWVSGVEVMEPLSRFPRVRNERGGLITAVAKWLTDRFGAPGRRYTYHTFFRDGRAGDTHIGFVSWKDAVEFRRSWR